MADDMFTNRNVPGPNGNEDWSNADRMQTTGYSKEKVEASTQPIIDTTSLLNLAEKQAAVRGETYDKIIDYDPSSFDIDEETMRSILNSSNIYSPEQLNKLRFNYFARYGILDMAHNNTGSREYLFFSKPDLHIFSTGAYQLNKQLANVTFFQNAFEQYPMSLLSLQQTLGHGIAYPNHFDPDMKYIPLLSNHVTSSLDLPAITATETENNTSLYQVKTTYRDSSEPSDFGYEFSLEFWDTRYLDVYMFFKAYDEYCRQEYYRNITPPKLSYITDKVNCKQFSIFKLIVDETNTIMFYGKATGVYPLGVPREAMSNFDGTIKITVPMKAQFVSDMDPIILNEINHLTASSYGTQGSVARSGMMPLYNKYTGKADTRWAAFPYIQKLGSRRATPNGENNLYKLMWVWRQY